MTDAVLGVFKGFIFLIVFCCILFVAYVTTRYIGKKTGRVMKGKYINIVETVSLGMDKQIHLIKVGEQFVLIASSGKLISHLTTLKLNDYNADETSGLEEPFDFKSIFEKYITNIKVKTGGKGDKGSSIQDNMEVAAGQDIFKNNLNKLRAITSRVNKQVRENGDDDTDDK